MYNKDNIIGVVFIANDTKFQIKRGGEGRVHVYAYGYSRGKSVHADWSVQIAIDSLNKGWWTPLHPIKSETYQIF